MSNDIAVAVIAFLGTLAGSYFSQRKSTALIAYRLEQLEIKVDKHNHLVERMYDLEGEQEVILEKIKVANNRISDLENLKK